MDTEYEKSRVERLKRGLYKPGDQESEKGYADLSPSNVTVDTNWEDVEILTEKKMKKQKPLSTQVFKSIVILAIVTVLSSGGYLLYQYFDPLGKPSDKNILITLEAPVGVTPGISTELVVRIENQNRVNLEYATLSILYPSGTRVGDNPNKDLNDEKKLFGNIAPGESIEYRTTSVFLGEENEEKNIRTLLEYRFSGINSIFVKEHDRSVRLLAAPVNLLVTTLKEVNAGQQLNLTIDAVSNTVIPLRDVFVKVEYPQGFAFSESEPKPTFGNNVWRVGTLEPTGKFKVVVHGYLEGQDTQQKVFHTSVGVGSDKTERDISTLYSKVISEIVVKRPFIGIALAINGKPAGVATAVFGQRIEGIIQWENNLPTRITNAQIDVKLRGVALDRSSVTAGSGGFYRSIDDTILWDERGDATLAVLESGEKGEVQFSFNPLPSITRNQLLVNPVISAEVTVRGKRLSDANVPEEIKTVMAQNVRISSEAQFVARGVYFTGPFVNSGPVPPRVEQETTYTIIWSLVNTSNNISDARVRGILPPYVKWYGSVSPSKEQVIYNKITNEIIWSPGEIPAGTGIGKPPREVAFQVVILPSLTQVKSIPELLTNITFTAMDTFTNLPMLIEVKDVNTGLSTDPKAPLSSGSVVE